MSGVLLCHCHVAFHSFFPHPFDPFSHCRNENLGFRVINCVFHADHLPHFAHLNDRIDRTECELGNGPANRGFYLDISDQVNDKENDAKIGDFWPFDDDVANGHVEEMKNDLVNPIQFTQSDHKAVKLRISLYLQAANWIDSAMTRSGTHDSDPWNFSENARKKGLKHHNGTVTAREIYYFYMLYHLKKDVLGSAFVVEMKESFKSCSEFGNVDDDDGSPSNRSGSTKRVAEALDFIKSESAAMNAKFDGIAKSIATKSDESLAVAKLNAVTNALQHIGGDKKRRIIEKSCRR